MIDFILTNRIQVFSVVGSVFLFVLILKLVRRRRLKEEYSLLWLAFCVVFMLLSFFKPLLNLAAEVLGIVYAPAALLLTLVVSIFCILIQFSMVISKLSESNKNLIQEVGILNCELNRLKKEREQEGKHCE